MKALEYIEHLNEEEKTALIYTDSRITLQLLRNHKRHSHIIDQIKNKVLDMERDEWKVEFSWVEAHAGQRGNGLADRLVKGASGSREGTGWRIDWRRKHLAAETSSSATIESRKVRLQES